MPSRVSSWQLPETTTGEIVFYESGKYGSSLPRNYPRNVEGGVNEDFAYIMNLKDIRGSGRGVRLVFHSLDHDVYGMMEVWCSTVLRWPCNSMLRRIPASMLLLSSLSCCWKCFHLPLFYPISNGLTIDRTAVDIYEQ